jgi:hypothetical protein
MSKIVSLVFFIFAMAWSWIQFHKSDQMSTEVHAAVQSRLQILIEETIKNKRPNIQNLRFLKMYSEKLDDNKIKAYFSYEFEDPSESTKQRFTGDAILSRGLSEDPNVKKWILQKVKAGHETIEFTDGISISAGVDGAVDSSTEATSTIPTPSTDNK